MKALNKKSKKIVDVEKVKVFVDEMTSYFVYENTDTKEQYGYNDLIFTEVVLDD